MAKKVTKKLQMSLIVFYTMSFLIIGLILPGFIVTLIPAEAYYSIFEPVKTDREEYKPGELLDLQMQTQTMVSTEANSVQELLLLGENGTKIRILSSSSIIPLLKNVDNIVVRLRLPEGLEKGNYHLQGIVTFELRGVKKIIEWRSTSFLIN